MTYHILAGVLPAWQPLIFAIHLVISTTTASARQLLQKQ
uniref:Uncharacterized protein n=1 Tax=Anguilla anguilla TaxID=7936 RepID=A0A0E9R5J7_ANGAN